MASAAGLTEVVLYDTLVNYLVSMARTVEGAMNRALDAIVSLEVPELRLCPARYFFSSRASTKWKSLSTNTPSASSTRLVLG